MGFEPVAIRAAHDSDVEAVRCLLARNGWAHRVNNVDAFQRLMQASQIAVLAHTPNGDIVGFARAITDFVSNGYLSMVVVDSAYRRRGIGACRT